MLDPRETERRNPRTASIDLASPLEIVDLINAEDSRVPIAVAKQREQIARAIELAEATFRRGGRLFYVGAGTSGRLGVLDASEIPPTFGAKPEMVQGIIAGGMPALTRAQEGAEDKVETGANAIDEHGVNEKDFVIGIAASGTTPYVRAALHRAAELGATTGIVACSPPPADLVARVDVTMLPIVGPEVVTGSTRMKAGTALAFAASQPSASEVRFVLPDAMLISKPELAPHTKSTTEHKVRVIVSANVVTFVSFV